MLLFSLKRVPSNKLQYLHHRCKSLCVCQTGSRPDSPTTSRSATSTFDQRNRLC